VISDSDIAAKVTGSVDVLSTETSPANLTVLPKYPKFSDWNSYVLGGNIDVACTGLEGGFYETCVHGGEARVVDVPGESDCSNLTMTDNLDAFDWKCTVETAGIRFSAKELKEFRGLRDLIGSQGWRNNKVVLKKSGVAIAESRSTVWWNNPVEILPDNATTGPISLDDVDDDGPGPDRVFVPGTILVSPSNRVSGGYSLNLNSMGFVTAGDSSITYSGRTTPPCGEGGETHVPGGSRASFIVCAGTQKFLWVEARLHSAPYSSRAGQVGGFLGTYILQSRIYRSQYVGDRVLSTQQGFSCHLCRNNYYSQIRSDSSGGDALVLTDSERNRFVDLKLANSRTGLNVRDDSEFNVFRRVTVASNVVGINLESARDNILTEILDASSETPIRLINGSVRNTISHISVGGAGQVSIRSGSNELTLSQFLGAPGISMSIENSANVKLAQLAFGSTALTVTNLTGLALTGNWIYGSGLVCTLDGNSVPCAQIAPAANRVVSGVSALTFVGALNFDDLLNTSDTSGVALYNDIVDWIRFFAPWRAWGKNGGQERCTFGQTCRIYDWRISASDTIVKNRSENGSSPNAPFIDGAACPPAVGGSVAISDRQIVRHTYLLNAVEIDHDQIGNDNGLCESMESCVYSPNFGSYLGEVDPFTRSCVFQDGLVSGVSMYAYPN
ncbi:MAG: hypothetical protein ABL958_12070, partial [Bdellovibrionia bacterium]